MRPDRRPRVLVIDDEEVMQDVLERVFVSDGCQVSVAGDAETGLARLGEGDDFDLVVLDLMLPGMSGTEALARLQKLDVDLPVIMITAHATVETAIEAMKGGAFDYVLKPFRNDELRLLARRAMATRQLATENRALRRQLSEHRGFDRLLGHSAAMGRLFDLIRQAAPSRSTILVDGESGTGKELVARAVHGASARADGPFVAVNCGGLAPESEETTLFGHIKGAFPGASAARKGLFEMAEGGSLFLDEVSSLGLDVQAKLLRVLQEREIERLGSSEVVKVDVRVIAATNADLATLVEDGRFRKDLFYRLKVISIRVPPLRERVGDVPLLAAHFLQVYGVENGKKIEAFAPRTLGLLEGYEWPGNVRELENVIQKAVVLCRGDVIEPELVVEDVKPGRASRTRAAVGTGRYRDLVEGFEREMIVEALRRTGGIQKKAAQVLGLKPTTLNEKMKRLGIRHREAAREG